MTTITPPPPTAPERPPVEPPRPSAGGSRVVAIIAIVIGALVLLGSAGSAIAGTLVSASVQTTSRSVDATGVDRLVVDTAAGGFRIEFADVDDAELEVTGSWGADRWTLERDGGTLEVRSPHVFGWMNWGGWFDDRGTEAILRLPSELEGLDADVNLSAGDLVAEGDFGDLDLDISAGRADVQGSAETLTGDMSAGRGELVLDDVSRIGLSVSAGSLEARFTGAQPDAVTLGVSAGSLRVTLPQGSYDVSSDVSAGGFDNGLGSTPGAASTVRVTVSAGEVVLRSDR